MIVTVLGSSAKQTSLRECVSVLVDTNCASILFDTGPGVVSSLRRANRDSSSINNIVLTHVHGDHILGFAYFIFDRNGELKSKKDIDFNKYSLTVYGQADTINLAKTTLDLAYPRMKLVFDLKFVEVTNDFTINIENTTMSFFDAIHAVPTLSTVVYSENKKLVYTSDTLPNESLYGIAQNAACLIHEGMFTNESFERSRKSKHSTSLDAAIFAERVHAKELVLVHIAPAMFGKESNMLKEVSETYSGIASIPFDGCVYLV